MTRKNMRRAAAGMALCLTLSSAGCGGSGSTPGDGQNGETTAVTAAETPADAEEQTNGEAGVSGTFEGTAQGFQGEIKVVLTLENGVLTAVTAEGPEETPDIGGRALELMPEAMAAANSVQVDIVSGATMTSNGILEAAAAALESSGAILTRQEVSISQHMKPGTYTGEAYGKWKEGTIEGERFGSPAVIRPTKVEVTVDETRILKVEVVDCSDTPGFVDACIERLPGAIVEQQSVAVDAVTGATMTSQAILNGVSRALKEAGADLAGFSQAAERSSETEEYHVRLVIVGAGAAGTMAAVEAMEAGIDTLVLEKCGKLGGTSACSTGFAAIQSEQQKAAGTDEYTVDSAFRELMDFCKWRANAPLVYNILSASGETADKLQSYWQQTDNPGIVKAGITAHDTGKGIDKFDVLYENFIVPSGINVMLETTAKSLIMDGGKVIGVEAKRQDGTAVTVYADNVLICTGGFGGNDEMLREYFGHDNFYLNGLSSNVGDGINMCLEAGAALSDELAPHLAEFCSNKNVDFYAGYMKFMNQAGFLALDPSGQRFVNEEFFVTQALSYGASALRRVGFAYLIFTQDQLDAMAEKGLWGVLSEETINSLKLRSRIIVPSYYTLKDEMNAALEAGEAWKADTLDELGEVIGFTDQEIYKKSIADYTQVLETGEDPLFGKRADMMPDLDNGPYYAVRVISAIDGTYNGIRVNENMQALNQEYQPIDGLYVAGQDSGGYFSYPYYEGVGWTQGYAWTSGAVAAKHIIEEMK